jgi:hypothetical protein
MHILDSTSTSARRHKRIFFRGIVDPAKAAKRELFVHTQAF